MNDLSATEFDLRFQPRRAEWIAVLLILAGFFCLNLWTYNLFPTVWADEVLWSEPAINLVKTGHFTTSVWQLQPAGTFWAAQSPLYCFLLSAWLPLSGDSLVGVRSFNYFLMAVGTMLVWTASWRCRLVALPFCRLAMLAVLFGGYGISFSYRCSRPDILGMVCLVSLALSFFARSPKARAVSIFICSAAAPWVGVQVGLYVFLAAFIAKFFIRNVTYREVLMVVFGLSAGGISMLLCFWANHALPYFMATLSQASNEHMHWGKVETYWGSVPRRLKTVIQAYLGDFSSLPLLAALMYFGLRFRAGFDAYTRRAIVFLILLFLAIPLTFSFVGHFAFYYSYMLFVPAVLAFFTAFGAINQNQRTVVPIVVMTISIVAAIAIGLPMRLLLTWTYCRIQPRANFAKLIQSKLYPDDVIFSDYPAFFECKQVAQNVYSPMYSRHFVDLARNGRDFSEDEKRRITVLVIAPETLPNCERHFGGKWKPVLDPVGDYAELGKVAQLPFLGTRMMRHFDNPQVLRRKLQMFRRVPD